MLYLFFFGWSFKWVQEKDKYKITIYIEIYSIIYSYSSFHTYYSSYSKILKVSLLFLYGDDLNVPQQLLILLYVFKSSCVRNRDEYILYNNEGQPIH